MNARPHLWGLAAHPIVLAPMAGGPGTPALAAAVSDAGGLGFLAAGYRSADQMSSDVEATRALTGAPFGVNVFVPQRVAVDDRDLAAYVASLAPDAARLGVDVGAPAWDDDDYDAKVARLVADPVAVVSFTFGCPARDVVARLQSAGTRVVVTVTTPAEAHDARSAGADGLCLQGSEAGAHRGSWDDTRGEANDTGVLPLVAATRDWDTVRIASGGLMEGRDVAAVLVAGAHAAQLGTAFLTSPEAGTHATYRDALAAGAASGTPTAITRAFSGRRARGIVNRFMVEHAGAPSAYPQVNHATRALRRAAADAGDGGSMSLWAGQGYARLRTMPAGELVATIAAECNAALDA